MPIISHNRRTLQAVITANGWIIHLNWGHKTGLTIFWSLCKCAVWINDDYVHEWFLCRSERKGKSFFDHRWRLSFFSVKQNTNAAMFNLQRVYTRLLLQQFPWHFPSAEDNPRQLKPPSSEFFRNNSCEFLIIEIEVSLSLKTGSQAYLITSVPIWKSSPPSSVRQQKRGKNLPASQSERSGWVSSSDIMTSNYPWPRASSVLQNLSHTADNDSLNSHNQPFKLSNYRVASIHICLCASKYRVVYHSS